jgi:aryl-alcohol dehydrogenase-like predicted oxidoreductase
LQWSPNARGVLARPWTTDTAASVRAETDIGLHHLLPREDTIAKTIVTVVEEIARERKLPMAVISTAWCICKGVSPIVGLNSKGRMDEVAKAVKVVLSEEEISRLEAAYVPKSVMGY